MVEYSPTSAFWLFNRITNFAYMRYDMMSTDIRKVTDRWENDRIAEIPTIDARAVELYAKKPAKAIAMLTEYSVETAQKMFERWQELDRYMLVKYIDGNVKVEKDGRFEDNGFDERIPAMPLFPGYNEKWKRAVVEDAGETLKVVK